MNDLTANLAEAWKRRADREAALPMWPGRALFTPEEQARSMADFRAAVSWYRYWTGTGAA